MRFLSLGLLVCALSACGGDAGPDAAYPDACGPIRADGMRPNTLLNVISANTTLKKSCSPYHIETPVTITAELTIEPGVEVIACQGGCRTRITVARNGKLRAIGTAAEPITFTSIYRTTGGTIGGQWTGILFLESQPGSRLEHVIVELAGGPYEGMGNEFEIYEFPKEGSILNDSTPDVELVNVTVRNSRGYAIAATTSPEFQEAGSNVWAAFEPITAHDNALGIWVPVDQIGTLGADVCFAERAAGEACPTTTPPANIYVEAHLDDELQRPIEQITRDATWQPHHYKVENIDIVNNALLRVLDGAVLHMTDLGGIYVGLSGPGALEMVAATQGGIRIRHVEDQPALDDYWNGIYIWDDADEARTRIENVDIGFGGGRSPIITEPPALIGIFDANPTIVGNHVHDSAGTGITWNCASTPGGLETPPLPNTNTEDVASISCAYSLFPEPMSGPTPVTGIAENLNCVCPGGQCVHHTDCIQ